MMVVTFRRLAICGACICLAIILVASLWPRDGGAPDLGNDKVGHFLAYAAMSSCLLAAGVPGFRRAVMVVAVSTLLGIVIEFIQPLVGRDASWLDAMANLAGALLGVITAWVFCRLIAFRS